MVSRKNLFYISVFLGEFFSSAFLLFLGCLGSIDKSPFFQPSMLTVSIVWGFAVMIGICCFGAVSGGKAKAVNLNEK